MNFIDIILLIVVGVTGSETSQRAARQAVEIAVALGATVHFVTAVSHGELEVVEVLEDTWEVSTVDAAEAQVAEFVASLGLSVDHTFVVVDGKAAQREDFERRVEGLRKGGVAV